MAWAVSLLHVGFIVDAGMLFVRQITDLLLFFKTIPVGAQILFAMPWIIGLLSLGVLVFLIRMWREGRVPLWGRMHYTLVALASMALFWVANFWKLI